MADRIENELGTYAQPKKILFLVVEHYGAQGLDRYKDCDLRL